MPIMASKNRSFYTSIHLLRIILLVSILLVHVRGRSLETFKKQGSSAPAKGTVKTIQGNEDIVDCVDVYKQPALNHPLLKDHKIQMDPNSYPSKSSNRSNSGPELMQPWHKYGVCSQGSVPIRRRQLQDNNSNMLTPGPHSEFGVIGAIPSTGKRFYGGRGGLSIWQPAVSRSKDSSASTLIVTLSDEAYIMSGWIVAPDVYGDFQSRFFIYWTTDNGVTTGCQDLQCDGFVQVNQEYALGSTFKSVSTLGADQQLVLDLIIAQDRKTGNWWLYVERKSIGYWPATLFNGIPKGALRISWGGQVYDSVGSGKHTDTDMGNGLFPDIGTNKASFVCSLQYVDSTFTLQTPLQSTLGLNVTNPLCYNAQLLPGLDPDDGLCFLYGGPGRNPRCP